TIIAKILYLFDLSSQVNFSGDPYRFFQLFTTMLFKALSLQALVKGCFGSWRNPVNFIKSMNNSIEREFIESLFPRIGSEDANGIKIKFMDWFCDLLPDLSNKLGKSIMPLELQNIERFLDAVIRRDYLKNFRRVSGTNSIFRSPNPENYLEHEDLLEAFLIKNNIGLIIDLREPRKKGINHRYSSLLKRLNIKRLIVNLTKTADGRAIGPSYAKRADVLKSEIGKVFKGFLEEDSAVLLHCDAGKDRTGIVAALFQKLANVSEDEIVKDYVLTGHDARESRILELLRYIQQKGGIEQYLDECGINLEAQNLIKSKI
ncbi:MAG: tyrosine-protein phosphatase, partial [Promethearchaeota archaeon]